MTRTGWAKAPPEGAEAPKQPLRFVLRTGTADAHSALDAAVGAFDGRDSYARYLDGLLRFRAPAEAAVAAASAPAWFGKFSHRPIAALIQADRADLALPPLADPRASPIPASASALVGILYVLEGSALGARLLYRRALAAGMTETCGARHLTAQAADRESWPRFMALLDQPAIDADEAVDSAIATFAAASAAFGLRR